MRLLLLAVLVGLVLAPSALAAEQGNESRAVGSFLREDKVADWLSRYPRRDRVVDAEYDKTQKLWRVHVWSGDAGEIATGKVSQDGEVIEAWTRPQVAWSLAPRLRRRHRRQDDQLAPGLAGLLRRLPARARGLAPAPQHPQPRPARPAVVLGLALVLQRRRHLHERSARVSPARLPAAARDLDRRPRPAARWTRGGRSGCSPRRRCSSPASGSASTSRRRT